MEKLRPESKEIYVLRGVQLFHQTELAKLLGMDRNTLNRKIKEFEIEPEALDKRGNKLFSVMAYNIASNRARLEQDGSERFGGYVDALEWKTAIDAQRAELKLMEERGELVSAMEAEAEIAACFSDNAQMGEKLLSIVDSTLHPSGEDMELISKLFKHENHKYYERVTKDTEHCEG